MEQQQYLYCYCCFYNRYCNRYSRWCSCYYLYISTRMYRNRVCNDKRRSCFDKWNIICVCGFKYYFNRRYKRRYMDEWQYYYCYYRIIYRNSSWCSSRISKHYLYIINGLYYDNIYNRECFTWSNRWWATNGMPVVNNYIN